MNEKRNDDQKTNHEIIRGQETVCHKKEEWYTVGWTDSLMGGVQFEMSFKEILLYLSKKSQTMFNTKKTSHA